MATGLVNGSLALVINYTLKFLGNLLIHKKSYLEMLIGKKFQNLSDVILKSLLLLKQINVLQI